MSHYEIGGNDTSIVAYRNYINKYLENIELMLVDVGKEECVPGYVCSSELEKRDECIIHKVTSGKGIFVVDGVEYKLEAGDCFYFYSKNNVYYRADDQNPMSYIWVTFLGAKSDIIMNTTLFADRHVVKDSADKVVENGINSIFDAASNGGNIYSITGLLYMLLGAIVDAYKNISSNNLTGVYYIDKAIEFIEKNYMSKCTVAELSDYLNLTRAYVYKLFKKHMGVSPTQYIENFRIEKACGILLEENISISECAAMVGYDDRSYFSRVFKKINGVSPKEFSLNHNN